MNVGHRNEFFFFSIFNLNLEFGQVHASEALQQEDISDNIISSLSTSILYDPQYSSIKSVIKIRPTQSDNNTISTFNYN